MDERSGRGREGPGVDCISGISDIRLSIGGAGAGTGVNFCCNSNAKY